MAFTYLKVKSAKCLLFTSGGFGLGLKNLVLFTSLPDPLAGGACCPVPEKYNTRSMAPSASIFGPSGLIRQPLPTVFISLQCIRVLIKTLLVPIFRAKECIRMQDFVLKIYQKFRGSRPPDPRSRRADICSHPPPCPPARCWCPPLLLGWLRPWLRPQRRTLAQQQLKNASS